MKKSKFLKSVAAVTLGAVAAAGCISLVACGGGHTHTTEHGWEKNSTQHWHVCDEDGEEYDKANHNYTLENGTKCECGATKSSQGGPSGEATLHSYNYSWTDLTTAAGWPTDTAQTTTDKQTVTQAHLTGNNAFLTVAGEVTWRCYKNATGGAIEVKNGGLTVTFQGTGSITIGFGSTSSSNTSGKALLKADGTYVEVASTTGTTLTADETVDTGYVNKTGLCTKAGGQKLADAATVTYNITEAGTYTIYSSYSYLDAGTAKSRGCRIWSIAMSDTY